MVKSVSILKYTSIVCAVILLGSMWISLAKKGVISKSVKQRKPAMVTPVLKNPQESPLVQVFVRLEAQNIGEKTYGLFNSQTMEILTEYAESILSKASFQDQKNPLYIDNPDLHRMVCFFVTSYVYAAEAQHLPKDTQIYLVAEDPIEQDQKLTLEIQHVQDVFNKCENLELQLLPTGVVYFNWDQDNFLNGVPLEPPRVAQSDIPEEFKDDPLLAQLYTTAQGYAQREGEKSKLGSEMVSLLLEGVKNQLASGHPNIAKLATVFAKQAGTKVAKQAWKEKSALIASLTKDDSNLFQTSQVQQETAEALTNLVALPGKATISKTAFTDSIKKIMSSDVKMNFRIGKDTIYAGFKLEFK